MEKIYKFKIKIWKDLSIAKKELSLPAYLPYKAAAEGLYKTITSALNIRCKSYNPHKEDGKLVYEQDCQTRMEAEKERTEIESFFFGEEDKFSTKEDIKKHLSKRGVQQALSKMKKKLKGQLIQGDKLLNFLNRFSIYVSWDIIEI